MNITLAHKIKNGTYRNNKILSEALHLAGCHIENWTEINAQYENTVKITVELIANCVLDSFRDDYHDDGDLVTPRNRRFINLGLCLRAAQIALNMGPDDLAAITHPLAIIRESQARNITYFVEHEDGIVSVEAVETSFGVLITEFHTERRETAKPQAFWRGKFSDREAAVAFLKNPAGRWYDTVYKKMAPVMEAKLIRISYETTETIAREFPGAVAVETINGGCFALGEDITESFGY